jgi:hypothetical protein
VNGLLDVLDILRPKITETHLQSLSDIVVGSPGNAYSSRFSDPLQACRDVHAITQEVGPSDEDISCVDTYTETESPLREGACIQVGQCLLHLDSTLDGVNGGGERRKNAVAGCISDAAPMLLNKPVHHLPVGRKGTKGADLVLPHEARVARHIGSKDRCQPPLDPF